MSSASVGLSTFPSELTSRFHEAWCLAGGRENRAPARAVLKSVADSVGPELDCSLSESELPGGASWPTH